MDATFLAKVKSDFPKLRFKTGRKFAFRPPFTVTIGPFEDNDSLLFLHEIGHFLTGHFEFKTEAERLKIEREAWDEAKKLASSYGISVDEEFIEVQLDTYRDWLHQKSRCPECGLTRFQTPDGAFHCPNCDNF